MHLVHTTSEASAAPTWAVGGPRRLNTAGVRAAEAAALALLASGARLAVGCCTGADAAAITAAVQAAQAEQLHVRCAFGPVPRCPSSAPGTCRWSAPGAVALAERYGAQVQPWAGGPAELPPAARLHRRTEAVAAAATAGALVLLHPRSTGAALLARTVARRGLPVLALPLGCRAEALPALDSSGRWEPAGRVGTLALPGALCWRAAQAALL